MPDQDQRSLATSQYTPLNYPEMVALQQQHEIHKILLGYALALSTTVLTNPNAHTMKVDVAAHIIDVDKQIRAYIYGNPSATPA